LIGGLCWICNMELNLLNLGIWCPSLIFIRPVIMITVARMAVVALCQLMLVLTNIKSHKNPRWWPTVNPFVWKWKEDGSSCGLSIHRLYYVWVGCMMGSWGTTDNHLIYHLRLCKACCNAAFDLLRLKSIFNWEFSFMHNILLCMYSKFVNVLGGGSCLRYLACPKFVAAKGPKLFML